MEIELPFLALEVGLARVPRCSRVLSERAKESSPFKLGADKSHAAGEGQNFEGYCSSNA